jgi:hypothetical protein
VHPHTYGEHAYGERPAIVNTGRIGSSDMRHCKSGEIAIEMDLCWHSSDHLVGEQTPGGVQVLPLRPC